MQETFIKKYWVEDDVLFYMHFKEEVAIRQIEISSLRKILLSQDSPVNGDSKLYDQNLSDLDLSSEDVISKEEFETAWNKV
jgi:hypothetical protein